MTPRFSQVALLAGLLLPLLAAPGCISVKVGPDVEAAPADVFHTLDAAVLPAGASGPKGALPAIAVRGFRSRDRIEQRVLTRPAEGTVLALEHDFWADDPPAAATEAVREALAASKWCASVSDPSDGHQVELTLDGVLLDLVVVGDLSGSGRGKSGTSGAEAGASAAPGAAKGAPAEILVRVRYTLASAATGEVVRSSVHEAREALPKPSSLEGLGPAAGRALGRTLAEAAKTWGQDAR